jgi:hypothetical protein
MLEVALGSTLGVILGVIVLGDTFDDHHRASIVTTVPTAAAISAATKRRYKEKTISMHDKHEFNRTLDRRCRSDLTEEKVLMLRVKDLGNWHQHTASLLSFIAAALHE